MYFTKTLPKYDRRAYRQCVLDAASFLPPLTRKATEDYCNNLSDLQMDKVLEQYVGMRPLHIEWQCHVSRYCKLSDLFYQDVMQVPGIGPKKAHKFFLDNSQWVVLHWPYEAFQMMHDGEAWRTSILNQKRTIVGDRLVFSQKDLPLLHTWLRSFYPSDAPDKLKDLAKMLRGYPAFKKESKEYHHRKGN